MSRFYFDGEELVKPDGIVTNVRAFVRVNILEERIMTDSQRGKFHKRPGRERQQRKLVTSLPILELTRPEYEARIQDAMKVLVDGALLDGAVRASLWSGSIVVDKENEVAELPVRVRSFDVNTVCGALISSTPTFEDYDNVDADPASVKSINDEVVIISLGYGSIIAERYKDFYILPYGISGAGGVLSFGTVVHFQIPSPIILIN